VAGDSADVAVARGRLDGLVRRCRSLTAAGWRTRREMIRALLTDLAALDAQLEALPVPEPPPLPDYALGDALAVIGGDVLDALGDEPSAQALAELVGLLERAWALTG
jgi:hypothetical protein